MTYAMFLMVCFVVGFSIIPLVRGTVCKRGLGDYKSLDFVLWKRTRYMSLIQCVAAGVLDRRCKGVEFNDKTFQCKCFVRFGYMKNLTSGTGVESFNLVCGHTQRLDKRGFLPGYIGCYEDTDHGIIDEAHYSNKAIHVISCLRECFRGKYSYVGLEDKHHCVCGNRFGSAKKTPDGECNSTCVNDAHQYCGSHRRLAAYYIAVNEDP